MNIIEYAARISVLDGFVLSKWQIDMLTHLEMGYGVMIDESNMEEMEEVLSIFTGWRLDTMCFPEKIPVQQVIRGGVMPGIHYHKDINVLDENISNILQQMELVRSGEHIMMKRYAEDVDLLKKKLMRNYRSDFRMFLANYINLQNSEN